MKFTKYLFLALFASLLLSCAAFGQAVTKQPYKVVEVEKFTVRQGVEFSEKDVDELLKATVANFRASNRFDAVVLAGETTNATGPKVHISGEVVKYVKGSQAKRYLIGMGAGKTKIIVDVKLTDPSTGEVVFNQTVDGDITWGLFGGDSDKAKGGVADEIIREMKKRGLAGDKKK
jgi:hypothetical protein